MIKKGHDAVDLLLERVKETPEFERYYQEAHVNVIVAQMIYDARKEAGLTQAELAKLVGTTQSVISQLEDSDYDGHSLSMLRRIATALNKKVQIELVPIDPIDQVKTSEFHHTQ